MIRPKILLIRTWFGPLPNWYPQWKEHIKAQEQYNIHFLVDNDLDSFTRRCKRKIGLDVVIKPGTRRAGDFDPVNGVLYEDELKGYDFWGHVGLDCCFGRIDRFITPELLSDCDVFGNDPGAICGPFSLYRNVQDVNNLFRYTQWPSILGDPSDHIYAFDEDQFSKLVNIKASRQQVRFKTALWQSWDNQQWHQPFPRIHIEPDGTLYDDAVKQEIMMFHFHRYRQWPL